MNHLKQNITIVLLGLSLAGFAQTDSLNHQRSLKHKVLVSVGTGYSTILSYVYDVSSEDERSKPISQSLVYNGTIDYGITDSATIGIAVAYQSAIAYPSYIYYEGVNSLKTQYPNTEHFTRLNTSVRALYRFLSKRNYELYTGVRAGLSFWTDMIVANPNAPYVYQAPTLKANHVVLPSFQVPIGIRVFMGSIGLHFEAAIGTPYFAEIGLTYKF